MGSKTFDGVWFIAYSHDHLPPHVHGLYENTEVLVDLLPGGGVAKSNRREAVRPSGAKRGDVRRIMSTAAAHAAELHELWEKAHGSAS